MNKRADYRISCETVIILSRLTHYILVTVVVWAYLMCSDLAFWLENNFRVQSCFIICHRFLAIRIRLILLHVMESRMFAAGPCQMLDDAL